MDGTSVDAGGTPGRENNLGAQLLLRLEQGSLDLPLLPEAVQRVLEATGNPATEPATLAGIIQRDATLSTRVLRVVNSAAYRSASPIVSLTQAVVRLGMTSLRDVAVVAATQAQVFRNPRAAALMRVMLQHALVSAWFAQELARARRLNVDEAFLAGLVHDLGEAVVFNALLETPGGGGVQQGPELDALCQQVHAQVGAQLLARWKLPPRVIVSTLHHHNPGAATDGGQLSHVVALADALSRWARGLAEVAEVKTSPWLRPLNLYADELAAVMQRKQAALDAAAQLL